MNPIEIINAGFKLGEMAIVCDYICLCLISISFCDQEYFFDQAKCVL